MTQVDQELARVEKLVRRADTEFVSRVGFFVSILAAVAGLCFMAWRLSAAVEAREAVGSSSGGAATALIAGNPLEEANRLAATARVQQAVIVAESYAAQNGTYTGVSTEALHVFDPSLDESVEVAFASEAGYCVQAASGSIVMHSTEPGQPAADSPCA